MWTGMISPWTATWVASEMKEGTIIITDDPVKVLRFMGSLCAFTEGKGTENPVFHGMEGSEIASSVFMLLGIVDRKMEREKLMENVLRFVRDFGRLGREDAAAMNAIDMEKWRAAGKGKHKTIRE